MLLKFRNSFFLIILINAHLFAVDFDSEIINYSTHYSVSESHKLTKTLSVLIKINNKEGEDLCNIHIPYSVKNKVYGLKAQIIDMDGTVIRNLKKNEIKESSYISNISLYDDNYIKKFSLKHNTYPYKIQYSYSIEYSKFFYITDWIPIIDFDYPTNIATLTLDIPKDFKINIKNFNIKEPNLTEDNSRKFYKWTSSYRGDYRGQTYSPDVYSIYPKVTILPIDFKYGISGKQDNWISFGNWMYKLNSGLDILPEYEKKRIDELIKNTNLNKEKIKILYKYLQDNHRYINVSIDIGGLKSYPASYVCENRFGDCKALTNYMKAVLNYAGINSFYSLIYAGENYKKIDLDFPGSQFNHVILFIPEENDTTWLECTNKYSPPGYLGTFTQNRNALVIKAHESEFIKTPGLTLKDTEEKRYISFNFNKDSSVVSLKFHLKGKQYERLLGFSNYYNTKQKEEYVHNFIPFSNYDLIDWSYENNSDASILFNARIHLKKGLETYENMKFTNLFMTRIPSFEKPKKRVTDIKSNFPLNIIDSVVYKKIEGYSLKHLKDTLINTNYGKYQLESKIENDNLIITKNFVLYSGEYKLNEYQEFYNFINSVKTIERKNPIIYIKK